MPIIAHAVIKAINVHPTKRFPPNYVKNHAEFTWHLEAKPEPAYWICLVQITAITSADLITIQCFNHNDALGPAISVDLADWTQVWRTAPSTIDPLPATIGELGTDTCAVLCLSDAVLKKLGDPADFAFAKYPYGEDAIRKENMKLLAALTTLRTQVSSEFFKTTIDHLGLGTLSLTE